jgi:hypothetical protein
MAQKSPFFVSEAIPYPVTILDSQKKQVIPGVGVACFFVMMDCNWLAWSSLAQKSGLFWARKCPISLTLNLVFNPIGMLPRLYSPG